MMDDSDAPVSLLEEALAELPRINRWLGGYRATLSVLDFLLNRGRLHSLHILDVGTGIGDYPRQYVLWGMRRNIDVRVVAIDASAPVVEFARAASRKWHPDVAGRITFEVADARALTFGTDSFDVATAALFFHHLSDSEAAVVLRQMSGIARLGVIVNDIHRTPLAFYGIRAVTSALGFSEMVRHDGPVSVLRAFSRRDLQDIAIAAGLEDYSVHWKWAFRWVLTNLRAS